MQAVAGEITGELERGPITWSNELVAHVVELKVTEPAHDYSGLAEAFQNDVRVINANLAPLGARLMPGGMHPWMDPLRETQLWSHEYNEVYEAFDRIFGCQGHGWSNLQSVHLNLPFANDDEFSRLHAAVRLVLPILPALTASSPVFDGRLTGVLDNRLEVYRVNSRKIPSITGRVIPEPVFSESEYHKQIFSKLFADIAPHDADGILQHEWLNARGAIARFSRGTIEIRVMDIQECPLVDVSICAIVSTLLKALVEERFGTLAKQQGFAVEPLEKILLASIRDADEALIGDSDYLRLFGFPDSRGSIGALWRHLRETLRSEGRLDSQWDPALDVLLSQGPLARRIQKALTPERTGAVDRQKLLRVYSRLCECLEEGAIFQP
jgi:gamma-glutamyl:cysteine ligase YbdK (ATP-grasp superfamily)